MAPRSTPPPNQETGEGSRLATPAELGESSGIRITLAHAAAFAWVIGAGVSGYLFGLSQDHEKRIVVLEVKRGEDDKQTTEYHAKVDKILERIENKLDVIARKP